MKTIKYFYLKNCPFCLKANKWLEEIFNEHPEYRSIPIEWIEESKEPNIAQQYSYYYVPTYFVDEKKLHEGIASKDKIKKVLEAAYES